MILVKIFDNEIHHIWGGPSSNELIASFGESPAPSVDVDSHTLMLSIPEFERIKPFFYYIKKMSGGYWEISDYDGLCLILSLILVDRGILAKE